MLPEKLKWTGSGINSYRGIRLCGVTRGTWSTSTNVFSSGLKMYEFSTRKRSEGWCTNESKLLFRAITLTYLMILMRASCWRAPGESHLLYAVWIRRSEMVTEVPNFCSKKSVIFAKCTLLILIRMASFLATSSSFLSMALKWFSWRLVMLTK
jgi:hypothetical protein